MAKHCLCLICIPIVMGVCVMRVCLDIRGKWDWGVGPAMPWALEPGVLPLSLSGVMTEEKIAVSSGSIDMYNSTTKYMSNVPSNYLIY